MTILRAVMVAALTALAAAAGAEEVRVSQEADVLVYHTWTDVRAPYKFNEYRSTPNGLTLDRYSLGLNYIDYRMTFEALHVDQIDQSYVVDGGKPGSFGYKLYYDDTPHTYATNARSPYHYEGGGVLGLPDGLQSSMQANSGLYLAISSGMITYMNDSADLAPLRVVSQTAGLDLSYRPGELWLVSVSGSRLHKEGTKPMGSNFGGGTAIELPVPINNNAYDAAVAVDYGGKTFQAGARASTSKFNNEIPFVIWDNPKRITDSDTATTKASYRGRMALDPDNVAHTVAVNAGVNLPMKSRASAEVSYTVMAQDQAMMPYTINKALSAGATTTSAGGTIPVNAWDPNAMPEKNVDAKFVAINQAYRLSSRGLADLRATAAYRSYDLKNRSAEHVFPGYVAADQSWVTAKTEPELFEYRKDNADVKLDYDLTNWLSLGGGAGLETRKLAREVPETKEKQYTGSLVFRPLPQLFVNGSCFLGQRRMKEFETADYVDTTKTALTYAETPGLRRFDVTDRDRRQARAQLSYSTPRDINMTFSGLFTRDRFFHGKGDLTGGIGTNESQMFGLLNNVENTYGADFSFPFGNAFTFDFYGEYELARRYIRSNSGGASAVATKDWTARTYETSRVGGASIGWKPGKFSADVGYDVVDSAMDTRPTQQGSALAYTALPKTKMIKQIARFRGAYKITENLSVIGRYAFEKFNVADYGLEDVPLMSDTTIGTVFTSDSIYLGNSLRDYVAHTVGLGLSYMF